MTVVAVFGGGGGGYGGGSELPPLQQTKCISGLGHSGEETHGQ